MSMMDEDDVAVMDEDAGYVAVSGGGTVAALAAAPTPRRTKTRSLSDGGGTPVKLSPSPLIVQAAARHSRDDSSLRDVPAQCTGIGSSDISGISASTSASAGSYHHHYYHHQLGNPTTPRRHNFASLHLPRADGITAGGTTAITTTAAPAAPTSVIAHQHQHQHQPHSHPHHHHQQHFLGGLRPLQHQHQHQHHLPQPPPLLPHLPTTAHATGSCYNGIAVNNNNNAAPPPQPPPAAAAPPPLPPPPPAPPAAATTVTPTSASAPSRPFPPPTPLSPKLDPFDHSQLYSSPTNILPRRSRGLDFSRAATSLHHSTLADHSSPDSSPTVAGPRHHPMAIPGRDSNDFGAGAASQSSSLWSMMGTQERLHITTNSLSSHQPMVSDDSSSEDDDDLMDEDMDEPYVSTPQVSRTAMGPVVSPGGCNLLSFQQRRRPRKQPTKRLRGPIGLGFSTASAGATSLSRSPPTAYSQGIHGRRESISLQANRLHISGSESEESSRHGEGDSTSGTPGRDGHRSVIRRVVTRRGNLLPKTKNFARIRAALAEEGAPVETEFRREAEVVRQVRENDVGVDHVPIAPPLSATTTAVSSPNLNPQDVGSISDIPASDIPDIDMMATDPAMSLSAALRQRALRNPKAKSLWDSLSETSSAAGSRTTPPPPPFLTRGSSEDVSMDSSSTPGHGSGPLQPMPSSGGNSQRAETPQSGQMPTAAEITRRINSKRRRDDDLDPVSFKRRAVSPGVSVHNSPVMQSPMQRDPWGSRPGSNGGDSQRSGGSGSAKGRVGFQGMADTSDNMMKMCIE